MAALSPDPRQEILALHRRLFEHQRQLIHASVQGYTPAFKRYEARYQRRVRGYQAPSDHAQLLQEISRSDVVYVGDYHTLKQAQRSFLKLVSRTAARGRPLVLALEFVQGRYQGALDAYLVGRLSEARFLERIRYAEHQVFDIWPNFRPLLELARTLRIPCAGIDLVARSGDTLGRRDAYAAARIASALTRPERPRVMVLTGQLHVAPPHLPARVTEAVARRGGPLPRPFVVYQNCEGIYWQLADRGLEQQVEVVRIREGEYCLVNTSPIVCQQSYLNWVEGEGEAEQVEASAPEVRFKEMARMVAAFLEIDADEALDQVEVFAAGDLTFFTALRARGIFTRRELALIKRQVLSRESYYIPKAKMVYLATLSVNHAAEEASHFVRHACAGDAMTETRGLVEGFYSRALEEAMGFFGSKVVNHRRKCAHEADWLRHRAARGRTVRQVAEMVLAHLALERGEGRPVGRLYHEASADLFNAVTHSLGYILGDKLYYAMLTGKVSKREIRELFFDPLDEEGAAFQTYFQLAQRVARTRVPVRI